MSRSFLEAERCHREEFLKRLKEAKAQKQQITEQYSIARHNALTTVLKTKSTSSAVPISQVSHFRTRGNVHQAYNNKFRPNTPQEPDLFVIKKQTRRAERVQSASSTFRKPTSTAITSSFQSSKTHIKHESTPRVHTTPKD